MRPHLIVKLHVPASGHVVHWQEAIDDKSGVHRGLQTDVDAVLARHGLDVWVTREHRPAGSSFSAPEIAAGLDRIYRLILASGAGFPQPLVDELATLPAVEYVRGVRIGATDEIGLMAVQNPHPFKDLHATILAALGLESDELYYDQHGRPERLTGIVGGAEVIPGVFA